MRKSMLIGVILAFTFAIAGAAIAQTKADQPAACKLKVTGMTCGGCEGAVKLAAKRVDGVKSVTVSYKTGSADVTYDASKTTPEAIAKAVTTKSGFKAEVIKK